MTAPAPVDLTRSERYVIARALREHASRLGGSAAFLRAPLDEIERPDLAPDERAQLRQRYDLAAAEMELTASLVEDLANRVLP